jgi:hypothetical protein
MPQFERDVRDEKIEICIPGDEQNVRVRECLVTSRQRLVDVSLIYLCPANSPFVEGWSWPDLQKFVGLSKIIPIKFAAASLL